MADDERSTIVCDVSGIVADAVAVDALARLALVARRQGRQVLLAGVSEELRELIAFVGLEDVLLVEVVRQAKQRKQTLGGEKERELRDPAV